MQRSTSGSGEYLIAYHTQESRRKVLDFPEKCRRIGAWLGIGYYFWIEVEFAHNWGEDSKTKTGHYDIYVAELSEDKILNACFNENEYYFFIRSIEKARKYIATKTKEDVNLESVNRFLADKIWRPLGIKGIIYDDLPKNSKRTYSDILPLYYKKRVQIVVFDRNNISTFAPYLLKQKC